jgi:hypothetical protein
MLISQPGVSHLIEPEVVALQSARGSEVIAVESVVMGEVEIPGCDGFWEERAIGYTMEKMDRCVKSLLR